MGEPHAHKTIELDALGLKDPKLTDDLTKNFQSLPEPQRFALETYSGNWMRDFSQVLCPMVIDKCKCMKKKIVGDLKIGLSTPFFTYDKSEETIGAAGAEQLVTGLLKALATVELGEEIGTDIVTPKNLGPYKAEEHMDNPAGLRLEEFVIRSIDGKEYVTANKNNPKVKTELASSAFKGKLQLTEKDLYEVSSGGLAKHIYGTIEWVKQAFKEAADPKNDRMNRVNFGKGLHGVEDYFGHSNFIEVAINSMRGRTAVDTLFSRPSKKKKGTVSPRCYSGYSLEPITTGTFGTKDTVISITHTILPLINIFYNYMDKAIDIFLDIAKKDEKTTWEKIKTTARKHRPAIALTLLLQGMDNAGITIPIIEIKTSKLKIPDFVQFYQQQITKKELEIEFPTSIELTNVPPTKAFAEYGRYYQIVKNMLDKVRGWILNAIPDFVKKCYDKIKSLVEAYKYFSNWLKKALRKILISVIFEGLLGISPQELSKQKKIAIEQLAEKTREQVFEIIEDIAHIEAKTALEVRVKSGDLKGYKADASIVPQHAPSELPPSHSEVCKDHPPGSRRSLFYELHIALATKADKHLMVLMHNVWKEYMCPTYIITNPSDLLTRDDLNSLNEKASKVAKIEKDNAQKDGRAFLQTDKSWQPKESMIKLLNAVDLYVSHPEKEKSWWEGIVKNFDAQKKLEEDILKRNNTRSHRKP